MSLSVSWLGFSLTGAMENWGLVTYRETALLVDPFKSSSSSKQWVALVVSHELAHQWFGNLVTMVRSLISVPPSPLPHCGNRGNATVIYRNGGHTCG